MSAPDFNLVLTTRDGDRKYSHVGVAWQSEGEKKGIHIQLNPGIVLDWRMMDDYYLSLYPKIRPEPEKVKMVWDEDLGRRVPA
jgi:hypothetical protein